MEELQMIYISQKERIRSLQRENEALRAKATDMELTSNITFVTLAENGTIDEVTATEHLSVFAAWEPGVAYSVGMLRKYEDVLYKCVQAHTSQIDWSPDKTPALWAKAGNPAVEYPEWSQPIGAHDAYMTGDKVSHSNKHWISTVNNNVWEPGVYGWNEVAE